MIQEKGKEEEKSTVSYKDNKEKTCNKKVKEKEKK